MSFQQIRSSRSLRLTLRFVIPLIVIMTLLAFLMVPLVDNLTLKWSVRDLDIRSKLITNAIQEPLGELLVQGNKTKINSLLKRATQDERLFALGYCDGQGKLLYNTQTFPRDLRCALPSSSVHKSPALLQLPQGLVHVAINPVSIDDVPSGSLVLVHDMSFVQRRSEDTRNYIVALFAILCLVISFITVLVAHLSWRGWMTGVRALLRGDALIKPFDKSPSSELQPLVGDLRALLRTMDTERRIADDVTLSWNPDALRNLLYKQLAGEQILVVSNREPYIHMKTNEGIELHR
ncbi:MAG: trehalose-6-phosphate synthase, partial [Deltaproteobacteria bacterium HGW-Deltaproteobacteria-5]